MSDLHICVYHIEQIRILALNLAERQQHQNVREANGQTCLIFHNGEDQRWMTDCAVANMVKFRESRDEHLRASVVHALLKRTCIVNDVSEAMRRKKSCRSHCPDMIGREQGE